jgi:hypothetical protein
MKSRESLNSPAVMDSEEDLNSYPCDSETVECLHAVVSTLLMKNETMRFELSRVNRKLEEIERLFFGSDSDQLQDAIPADISFHLRNLCRTEEPDMRRWNARLALCNSALTA